MSEHMLEWLPAYHDNELPPTKRSQVEKHLRDCPSCRAELQTLTGLSALLKIDPASQSTPPERFAAQVQLLLPRRAPSYPQRLPRWVLGAPLALVVVGAFLQAALWVTWLVLAAGSTFPGLASWLPTDSNLDIFGTLSVLNIALLAGAVILWCAWMAFWWAWKYNQNLEPVFNQLEKEV
ncbi:MAG: zf-HC2 domain-containing protein [Anaerolineales bacterium]